VNIQTRLPIRKALCKFSDVENLEVEGLDRHVRGRWLQKDAMCFYTTHQVEYVTPTTQTSSRLRLEGAGETGTNAEGPLGES
jgi:hypothetical protein